MTSRFSFYVIINTARQKKTSTHHDGNSARKQQTSSYNDKTSSPNDKTTPHSNFSTVHYDKTPKPQDQKNKDYIRKLWLSILGSHVVYLAI